MTPTTNHVATLFNPMLPEFASDPYPIYRRIRESAPLHRSGFGPWIVADRDGCEAILRSQKFGKDFAQTSIYQEAAMSNGIADTADTAPRAFMLMDPPEHTRMRGIVSAAYKSAIGRISKEVVDGDVDRLLSGWTGGDVVADVAQPLSGHVLGRVLGIADDELDEFSRAMVCATNVLDDEHTEFYRSMGLVEDSAAGVPGTVENPHAASAWVMSRFRSIADSSTADDGLLGALTHPTDGSPGLTPEDAASNAFFIGLAAFDPVVKAMTCALICFAREPEQYARLCAEPEYVDSAVQEVLRCEHPAPFLGRVALEDTFVNGQLIGQGEPVIVVLAAGNRDEAFNADGESFDIFRTDRRSLNFGRGVHHCLGPAQATLTLECFVAGLIARWSTIEIVEPFTFPPVFGLRGPNRLCVSLR